MVDVLMLEVFSELLHHVMVLCELGFPPVVLVHRSVVFVEFVRVNEELIVNWLLRSGLVVLV